MDGSQVKVSGRKSNGMASRARLTRSAVLLGRERTKLTRVDISAGKVLRDDIESLCEVLLRDLVIRTRK